MIKFILNGKEITVCAEHTQMRLVDYLRDILHLRGTKVSSGTGNTGASVVVLSEFSPNGSKGEVIHKAVNSSLLYVFMAHNKSITTIEGLTSGENKELSAFQQAFDEYSSAQCGYCTPGIIMSLSLMLNNHDFERSAIECQDIEDVMSGHLCRCTGYASFYQGISSVVDKCNTTKEVESRFDVGLPEHYRHVEAVSGPGFFLPSTISEALAYLTEHKDATVIAGNVDLAYQKEMYQRKMERIVSLQNIAALKRIEFNAETGALSLGAMTTVEDLRHFALTVQKDRSNFGKVMHGFLRWFGSPQIRSQTTIGGIVSLRSDMSDLMPVFMAMGAQVHYVKRGETAVVRDHIMTEIDPVLITSVEINVAQDKDLWVMKTANRRDNTPNIMTLAVYGSADEHMMCVSGVDGLGVVFPTFESNMPHLFTAMYELCKKEFGEVPTYFDSNEWPKMQHDFDEDLTLRYVNRPVKKADNVPIVKGEASYTMDIVEPHDCLYASYVTSVFAHAKLLDIDFSMAETIEGYVGHVSAEDCKRKELSGIVFDTRIFAYDTVDYWGEPIAAVIATSQEAADRIANAVIVRYEELTPLITVESAHEKESWFDHIKLKELKRGDVNEAFANSKYVVEGVLTMGGQEHVYMETHNALCIPDEPLFKVYSSTQNISKVQADVAAAIGIPMHGVQVQVHRLGGGFGGKQDRPCFIACAAAVAAKKFNRPVRLRLPRRLDMQITGGRHPWTARYKASMDENGTFTGGESRIYFNAGSVFDVSGPVMEKMVCQAEGPYYWPNWHCSAHGCRLNQVTGTAFRGFGSPQALFLTTGMMEHLSRVSGISFDELSRRNFLKPEQKTIVTCFVEDNVHTPDKFPVPGMFEHIVETSEYEKRLASVEEHNTENKRFKRGIFAVAQKNATDFELDAFNQGGALLHVYHDGSVQLSHSAVEMGQGVHTKMAAIAAEYLKLPFEKIHVVETDTTRVPNTMPTAASSGADVAGPAVIECCQIIMNRLEPYFKKFPEKSWEEICWTAYWDRCDMSAEARGKLPELTYSWDDNTGYVGFYYAWGTTVSEVELDTVTGQWRCVRADVLQDVGNSLNPEVDVNQIRGAYMQGLGLFTMEKLTFDKEQGYISNNSLARYQIPTMVDMPREFNIELVKQQPNPLNVCGSKASAEGPLNNAVSVLFALKQAITSARADRGLSADFTLNSPATVEEILRLIHE
ncbi:hypothetical protein PCE1_001905 [Barthelona sp. PCE]